jgi:tRNA threonylcarbamoyladenosine biosynthesis protein TsaB
LLVAGCQERRSAGCSSLNQQLATSNEPLFLQMRVIALDTTTRIGSVALVEDDRIVDERAGDGLRTHAQRLPAEILAIAGAHGVALADVDLYAVACGPGSFTGLRIGIATIQGLAFVHGRKVAGISALDALAHAGSGDLPPGTIVAAWMDAHRREVFAAAYRVTTASATRSERMVEVEEPTVGDPAETLARWRDRLGLAPRMFVGDGATLYADVVAGVYPAATLLEAPLLAGTIGQLAIARREAAVEPGGLRALYVRRPDAELERDRKALNPR